MPARALTQNLYKDFINYYRAHPGDFTGAHKHLKVTYTFAKRVYLGPPYTIWPWAEPIKQVLSREAEDSLTAKHDAEVERRSELAALAAKQRANEQEANTIEENILRVARNDVLGGLVGFAKIVSGIGKLAERVNHMLEAGIVYRKDPKTGLTIEMPLELDPAEAIKVMGRFSLSARALVSAADTVLTMQRLRGGLPTSIIGVELASATIEDAEKEVALAQHALSRARELGLIVHKGGKDREHEDMHFDRTASDRDDD